jgi:ribosomal protein L31
MNMVMPIVTILFFILIIAENTRAQQSSNNSWGLRITAQYGYPFSSNNWGYSHPFYTGTGVQTINETGSFNAKSVWGGGIELSKGQWGVNVNAGIIPAEIIVDKSGQHYNFNSTFLEI